MMEHVINVYLDDMRRCPQGFVLAKSATECIILLQESEVNILSLDHDLGWDEPTGYEVVKFIVEQRIFPKEIYIHTANPVGRMNMFQLLYRYKPEEVKLYNYALPDEVLRQVAGK